MKKEDIDYKLITMLEIAKELSDAPIPVVKHRSEMIVALLIELMETVVDDKPPKN